MAQLTARGVRIRAVLLVVLVAFTFAWVVLAMVFGGGPGGFMFFVLLFDIPIIVLVAITEWLERAHA